MPTEVIQDGLPSLALTIGRILSLRVEGFLHKDPASVFLKRD
jgi:hypothetical protein